MAVLESSPFDGVAEIYDRVRPSYPDELFDELFARLAETRPGPAPEVVEIGPGTGQATRSLLARGARVTAVELGPRMAARLRANFADDPRLSVVNAAFEAAELAPSSFDMVFSATAFHWVDAAARFAKPHALLRPGGLLAVLDTVQVASEADRGYFERSYPIYWKYRPDEVHAPGPPEDAPPALLGEMRESGLFEDVRLTTRRWDQRYATAEYADLVRSYSNTQSMEPAAAEGLIAELCALIDAEYEGYVLRPLVITLVAGRRVGA